MSNTPPADVIRDGNLKASIWQNESEKGSYFTTTFSRTYKDERGDYRDTNSFSNSDLLRVSELARHAYTRANELRREKSQLRDSDSRNDDRDARLQAFKEEREGERSPERDYDQRR